MSAARAEQNSADLTSANDGSVNKAINSSGWIWGRLWSRKRRVLFHVCGLRRAFNNRSCTTLRRQWWKWPAIFPNLCKNPRTSWLAKQTKAAQLSVNGGGIAIWQINSSAAYSKVQSVGQYYITLINQRKGQEQSWITLCRRLRLSAHPRKRIRCYPRKTQ